MTKTAVKRLNRVCNRISRQLPDSKEHPLEFWTLAGDPERTICFLYLGSGMYVEHEDIKKCATQKDLTVLVKGQIVNALQEIRKYATKQIKALEDVK